MDEIALRALKASIVHWQENVNAPTRGDMRIGGNHCPLCKLYVRDVPSRYEPEISQCNGCPIKAKTGEASCVGTPYERVVFEWLYSRDSEAPRPGLVAAAKAELEFLRSLLPEGESA